MRSILTRQQRQNRTTAAWLLGFVVLVLVMLGASVSFYQMARQPLPPATASGSTPPSSTPDINHALL